MVIEIRIVVIQLGERVEMGKEQEGLFWGAGKGLYLNLVGDYMGKNSSSSTISLGDFVYVISPRKIKYNKREKGVLPTSGL